MKTSTSKPGMGHNGGPPLSAESQVDLTPLERRRKIPVPEAAALNGISEDTFRRHYKHLIRKITPRRDGVELGDAIDLPKPA